MKLLNLILTAGCGALVLASLSPRPARADEWNDRTIVSFSNTVEVPGATLPAGTYVFQVLQSSADRDVVQISNQREDHVFATLIAIPDYYGTAHARLEDAVAPTESKTLITFYETPSGHPEAIKEWFYPSQGYGLQFAYPKGELAGNSH